MPEPLRVLKNGVDSVANPGRKIKWPIVIMIVGGGVGGYWVYRAHKNSQEAADQAALDATSGTDSSGDLSGYDDSSYGDQYGENGFSPPYGVVPSYNPPPSNVPQNLAEWVQMAIDYDEQHGFANPIVAIDKYTLTPTAPLTQSQYNAVEAAIAYFGKPPGITHDPVLAPPGPAPKPKPKPHRDVKYTTKKGDTLRIISQRYGASINSIKHANARVLTDKVGPFTRLKPGLLLIVPNATRGF